jgi:hypothetical protein
MFIVSKSIFVRDKPFKNNVISKGLSLPLSGAPKMCFTLVGFGLTRKQYARPKRPAKEKHSSLFLTFVNYSRML